MKKNVFTCRLIIVFALLTITFHIPTLAKSIFFCPQGEDRVFYLMESIENNGKEEKKYVYFKPNSNPKKNKIGTDVTGYVIYKDKNNILWFAGNKLEDAKKQATESECQMIEAYCNNNKTENLEEPTNAKKEGACALLGCNSSEKCPICKCDLIPNLDLLSKTDRKNLIKDEVRAREEIGLDERFPWAIKLSCMHKYHLKCIYHKDKFGNKVCKLCSKQVEPEVQELCNAYLPWYLK